MIPRKTPTKLGAPAVPKKSPTVLGGPALPAKRGTFAAPRKAPAKSWSPRQDVVMGRAPIKGPIRHVEAPPLRPGLAKDFWMSQRQMGDMVIAMDNMSAHVLAPNEETPVHPYLVADWMGGMNAMGFGYNPGGMDQGALAQPVQKGTVGIYAGSVRVLERGKNGNIAILRHTVIFPTGRYIIADLNLVHPAL